MKKLLISGASIAILSANLIGCGWNNTMNATESAVVTTGAVVDNSVATGVGLLVGRPVTRTDMVIFQKRGVVYHHGHAYRVAEGKYVLVR